MNKAATILFSAFIVLIYSGSGYSQQTWVYDFGTDTVNYTEVEEVNPSTFPSTQNNGGDIRLRIGTGTGEIALQNPVENELGTGSNIRILAPTNTSQNLFQIYGFDGRASFSVKFNLRLSGNNSGTLSFLFGSGESFGGNTGYIGDSFSGFRSTFQGDSLFTERRTSSGWSKAFGIDTVFKKDIVYEIEIFANNSSEGIQYFRNAESNLLDSRNWELWIDEEKYDDFGSVGLSEGEIIDGFMFYGESSSDNSAQIEIDDIVYSNALPGMLTIDGAEGFRLISSPVVESTIESLLSENNIFTQCFTGADYENGICGTNDVTENVFFYGADTWTPATNITDPISPGTGVLVYVFEDDDPAQEGITGGFPKTINVSGAENSADITPAINENDNGTNEGFTLLGNPFNTAIDFNELDKPDIEDAIYIWDVNDETGIEGGNSGAGSWKTYALGAGDITDGVIAPFQGFFVQNSGSSTGSVSFTEGSKTVGGEFYGKQVVKHLVRLELSGEGMSNSAWLRFSDQGSFDKTNGDALQLNPLSNNYALMAARKSDDVLVDIGHVPYPTEDFLLPIEIEVTKSGFYSISVTDLNLADGTDLYFEDRQKNISLLLDDAFTYSFELESMAKVNPNPLARIKEGNMLAKTTTTGRFVITANTSVSNEDETSAPTAFSLHQNYPNPFNPTTNIKYSIAQSGGVSLTIYNVMGQKVAMLVNEVKSAGNYQVNWDAANMASGVYYYRLQSAGQIKTRQMTLIK